MPINLNALKFLALPAALTVLGGAVGWLVRRTVLVRLARAAARTVSQADDIAIAAIRGPVVLWGAVLGLYIGLELTDLPRTLTRLTERSLIVLLILSITWALSRLAGELVRRRTEAETGPAPSSDLLTLLVRATVITIGALFIFQALGISITPLITALGVGGLAVGLALQDTLSNLFAGIHLLLSRQVRTGDFIKLSSGEDGYVQDVTWRYTTIRQTSNHLTIVPNSKLASTVTANYSLPDPEEGVSVEVGVSYGSDLAHVERVTVAVAQAVMREVEGGIPEFTPSIRYHTFADSSIQLTVNLRGRDYVAQYLIKHEFIKRLHQRYQTEGIEIPFPVRTVYLAGPAGPASSGTGT